MAIGAIDFILLDNPLVEASNDFEIDVITKHIDAMGLNPRTSYWFGKDSRNKNSEDKTDSSSPDGAASPEI